MSATLRGGGWWLTCDSEISEEVDGVGCVD